MYCKLWQLSNLFALVLVLNHCLDLLNFIVFLLYDTDIMRWIWIYTQCITVGSMLAIGFVFSFIWYSVAIVNDGIAKKSKLCIAFVCFIPVLIVVLFILALITALLSVSALGLVSIFIAYEFSRKYHSNQNQFKLLRKLRQFMQGQTVRNDFEITYDNFGWTYMSTQRRNEHRQIVQRFDNEQEQLLNKMVQGERYENDDVIRALSVNHGYFNKSQFNSHCHRDEVFAEYLHSIETDLFRVQISDLRTHTVFMHGKLEHSVYYAYFYAIYWRQYDEYKKDFDRYCRHNAQRSCIDWIEYGLPYLYLCLFNYVLFPLYIVSRLINILYPALVLVICVINDDERSAVIMWMAVVSLLLTVGNIIALRMCVWKIYVMMIFNVAFGVIDVQFLDGYYASKRGVFGYVLNYYASARVVQVIKPMLIAKTNADIAGIILHYWLSFDQVMDDYVQKIKTIDY